MHASFALNNSDLSMLNSAVCGHGNSTAASHVITLL